MTSAVTTTIRSTRETVEEFLSRFAAGDPDGMLELFAPDADFHVAGADRVPWAGRRTDPTQVAAFLRSVLDDVETQQFSVDLLLVDGDHAVVLGAFAHRVRSTSKIFAGPYALHIGVRQGLIGSYHMFEDSYAAAVAFTADVD